MLRDVFYYGKKPNVHPREQLALNLADARLKATTRDFWIINEFCDYRNFDWDFDFEFLPDEDVWAEDHNNVWPSQHQKDSGTWLCPKEHSDVIIYRNDVDPVQRKNEINDFWVELDSIDHSKFDFSWHPDPTDPPYVYKWPCKFFPAEVKHILEYVVPGATQEKYVDTIAELLPEQDRWVEYQAIDKDKFDLSWRPNPLDPPFIYVWGNKYIDSALKPTLEYIVPGATDKKYMKELVSVLPETDKWKILEDIDTKSFDFSWRPDPREPAYIYTWGNKYVEAELKPTIEYHCDGATDRKYMTNDVVVLPEYDKWHIIEEIEKDSFDFSWRPDPREPPFIYVFGNEQYDGTIMPTVEYHCDNATVIKHITDIKAKLKPNKELFEHFEDSYIDYSWRPNPTSPPYIYVWGNQWNSAEEKASIQYVVDGATEFKYMTEVAIKKPCLDNWIIPKDIDVTDFDLSWEPNPNEPPYIYEFGTQWQKTGGPQYVTPGATVKKYIDTQKAKRISNRENWKVPSNIDCNSFDFSWHPDDTSPPYIYVFATQWAFTGGPIYTVAGATEIKYVTDQVAMTKPDTTNYVYDIDMVSSFDFSWVPHPDEPPYIYVFGNQWYSAEKMPTVKYVVPGATEYKYMSNIVAKLKPDMTRWVNVENLEIKDFDYSWVPDPHDPPYKYVFGNQWHKAQEMPTLIYQAPGATDSKFVNDTVAILANNYTNWEIDDRIDISKFDFSWIPHPASPPYIYQFGTKLDNTDGPRYVTPDNNGEIVYLERVETQDIQVGKYYIETTLEDLVNEHPNEIFWALNKNIDYTDFDFSWRPDTINVEYELNYVHTFGSIESTATQTYFVSAVHYLKGNTDFKFVDDLKLEDVKLQEFFVKPDLFFVDRGNIEATSRFEYLKEKFGSRIQKTRYLNSWVDTINRCINRATTDLIWVLDSMLDYSEFDFDYYPNPWQLEMVHIFGTQWSQWGTTFMINVGTFPEDTKYIKIVEHLSNLNFVKHNRAAITNSMYDIVVIDHGNSELNSVVGLLKNKVANKNVSTISYSDSYLTTIKNIIDKQPAKKDHYIWICSSVCDYTNFDFSYVVDPFAREQLHVFPSGIQKFGDTFFVDVNKAKEVINELTNLEQFDKVNYNQTMKVNRLPEPVIVVNDDTHCNSIDKIIDFPYATFITSDNIDITATDIEPMNLWSSETKTIYVTSTGATRITVPKEAKDYVKKELYEYPYIKRKSNLVSSTPMDIVFLSNGETMADENYAHLLNITKHLPNRVVRVDGVNGRVAAYHKAAEASNTPWLFTVFAKLTINPKFNFDWQPDRMQVSKHYIFHAKNPVNDLIYGHQAMIAYNKKLVLANQGQGLDFTLDDEHEVVPLVSGTAHYNTDEFSTWRTAFREVIKLKNDPSDISKDRLDAWLTKAVGNFAEYSIKGALDASEYYDEVDGDFDKLKLSYEWDWLRNKFNEI